MIFPLTVVNSLHPIISTDELGANGHITVLNSERLKAGNGTLQVIHGYAVPSKDPGKLSVHLEKVPVNAPCEYFNCHKMERILEIIQQLCLTKLIKSPTVVI